MGIIHLHWWETSTALCLPAAGAGADSIWGDKTASPGPSTAVPQTSLTAPKMNPELLAVFVSVCLALTSD